MAGMKEEPMSAFDYVTAAKSFKPMQEPADMSSMSSDGYMPADALAQACRAMGVTCPVSVTPCMIPD